MQEQKYNELEDRATNAALQEAERKDAVRKLEARAHVHAQIEQMRNEGKALTLTEEEDDMLRAFRRFKWNMRKQGEVFKWQTRMPERVEIVPDTALIAHPDEG